MVVITFPDGSKKEFDSEISCYDIAKSISDGLANAAVAAEVDGKIVDLSRKIFADSKLRILTERDKESLDVLRHSSAHVMAEAIMKLFPNAKFGIGPSIDNGFYYDIDDINVSDSDLVKVEEEIKNIIKEKQEFVREDISKKDALELFKNQPFKLELINELDDGTISIYKCGNFVDLCRGPHLRHSGKIKAIKLQKVTGAYWRGDAKNKMLTRIYGTAFFAKKDLDDYVTLMEEAEKRDHRKLGKRFDIFSLHEEGPGFPFFHPNGMVIWNELMDFWREEHRRARYVEVKTPIMLNRKLWETSGHWFNYKENMYTTQIDGEDFAIKPMNCPGGMILYKDSMHSYRELPMRVGEIGLVHRHELSGALAGLFRVRTFHQDDAHIFMTTDQIKDEILGVLNLADRFYKKFGLDYHLELSTRPEKSVGTDEQWEAATNGLKTALDATGKEYQINEGDGAFYGPKIDLHIKDAIGRTWQCGTIQLDMSLPERFDLTYEGSDGNKHRPVMIHRVIYGSIERFLGVLIEHYAAKFPLWLSPVQVIVLPVSEKHRDYAQKVYDELFDSGLRVELDESDDTISKKVRNAQLRYVNYILVVGDKEQANNSVNVRTRDNEIKGEISVKDFIADKVVEYKNRI
ncbi:threonine--tRNA ligase [Candidatus Woesearchaeota archaeon]|nr:threonine--tRNA ligase [Candidatus Woesearchaeota archaeon]